MYFLPTGKRNSVAYLLGMPFFGRHIYGGRVTGAKHDFFGCGG
jgi:hypothetical protein